MRIISKFKDYYDSASSFGIDTETLFIRETEEKEFPKAIRGNKEATGAPYLIFNHRSSEYYVQLNILGFCGEIFPCVNIVDFNGTTQKNYFFYNIQSFKDFIKDKNIPIKNKSYFTNEKRFHARSLIEIEKFFNTDFGNIKHLFRENHSPTFLIHSRGNGDMFLTKNPKLSDFDFHKVKDAHSAFQEIFMFISGVLGNIEKETSDIPDKFKIQQKGFDNWSFKKPPQKK